MILSLSSLISARRMCILDPAKGTGTTVPVGGIPGFSNSGPRASPPPALNSFVGMSGDSGSSGACSACLAQMNLAASPPSIQIASQPEVTSLTGARSCKVPLLAITFLWRLVLPQVAGGRVERQQPKSVCHFPCQRLIDRSGSRR